MALVKMQGEIEGAKKAKRNPGFNSKYADLSACWDACREALQSNEIALLQFASPSDAGRIGITTVLVYGPTGETLSESFGLPCKDPTNPQALGSAITYGRRYGLCAAIGICPVDDDGNSASGVSAQPKQESKPTTDAGALQAKFDSAVTVADKKTIYSQVKNSDLAEPKKTEVLSKMADVIKGMK
jgi:hypothetical protein